MLPCPRLPAKTLGELAALARDIPRYPGVPAKQRDLLARFNDLSGLRLEMWQFNGSVFWPTEVRTFVECALSFLESPAAPSTSDAVVWIRELRERNAPMADVHHTLRALERLSPRPDDVSRLVFFTEIEPERVLEALVDGDPTLTKQVLGTKESKVELGDVDVEELTSLVALADQGIECSDRGDRAGLSEATRTLSKRTKQNVSEQELRAVPGTMNTESWVRGLLLARNLLQLEKLTWSQCRHVVARYVASIQALRDPETTAFAALLDSSTPYPHLRIHSEMGGDSPEELDATLREITRHVPPWGDAPAPPPAVTVEVLWQTARGWAKAREGKDWPGAVSLRQALEQGLERVDVPELRELLRMPEVERRAQMRMLGLLPPETESATGPAAPAAPPARTPGHERVSHPKFGPGEVLSRQGSGDLAVVEVRFADGVRKLQAKFLRPVE